MIEPNVISFEAETTQRIIGLAMQVHKELGPGLLESVYEACLEHELRAAGFHVERQHMVSVHYKDIVIDQGFRIDLLIDDKIVIEVKSCEKLLPVHKAQLITYLKLAKKPVGLLLNFNQELLKDGMERVIRKEYMNNSFTPLPHV